MIWRFGTQHHHTKKAESNFRQLDTENHYYTIEFRSVTLSFGVNSKLKPFFCVNEIYKKWTTKVANRTSTEFAKNEELNWKLPSKFRNAEERWETESWEMKYEEKWTTKENLKMKESVQLPKINSQMFVVRGSHLYDQSNCWFFVREGLPWRWFVDFFSHI